MSVSFTDEDPAAMSEKGYLYATCRAGNIYYPAKGLVFTSGASVNYMEYPWISCCETSGIQIDT